MEPVNPESPTTVANGLPLPEAALLHAQLEKIICSGSFAGAARAQLFLRFIVEESLAGRAGELKETVLASEIFGRKDSFDPRLDSIVRVVGSSVRKRLNQYYLTEGVEDPVVIELHKGGYAPVIERRVAPVPPVLSVPPPRRRWLVGSAAGIPILSVLAYLGIHYLLQPDARAVAVLRFVNLDGGAESDHLAEALAGDMTTRLAQSPRLRVMARTSMRQFEKGKTDARTIGQRLAVGTLLSGSLRRSSGQVKMTAKLIRTHNGYLLWSESFEGPAANAQRFQERIRQGVGRALGIELALPPAAGSNPPLDAQEAYSQGRYLLNKGPEGRVASLPYLEKAVRIDADYAIAHAALATAYSTMAFHEEGPPAELAAKTKLAARRALDLDPGLAEADVALATVAYSYERDWPRAEQLFQRALAVNPNDARAYNGYGIALLTRGRVDDAIANIRRARELTPLTNVARNDLAVALWCAHRCGEVLEVTRRSLELEPKFAPAHLLRGECLAELHDLRAAEVEFQQATLPGGRAPWILGPWGYARARYGDRSGAEAILRELEATAPEASFQAAFVLAGLGDRARVFQLLERSIHAKEVDTLFMSVHPAFEGLRNDPRFQALRARLGY